MNTISPMPKANAMLICDSVITEVNTNKKSLIGIFENINVVKFPYIHHALSVYIKLTDANGIYRFKLELIDLTDNSVIGKAEIPKPINIEDPLKSHELVFNLRGLRFQHSDQYEFRLFANDNICAQKTFKVKQITRQK